MIEKIFPAYIFVLKSISNDNFHYLCLELVSDEHFFHLD